MLLERTDSVISFTVFLDDSQRVDRRFPLQNISYLDSYLDEIILPFAKANTISVTMNGAPVPFEGPDDQGRIVFYRQTDPGSNPPPRPGGAVSGAVTVSYEIDWDVIGCDAEVAAAPLQFLVRNYSLTEPDSPWFGMGTIKYASYWLNFQALDFCSKLFLALLEAGYVTADGQIRMDNVGLVLTYETRPVSPSSPGWGWSMPNHYRRVEVLSAGHLVYKDGANSILRWRLQGDSYVAVEPKNLVKAGLLDDGRFVLTFPDLTRLYFDTHENRGRILAEEDPNGNLLTYEYEPGPGGFLANVNDGKGRFFYFVHGSDGQPTALRDVRGKKPRNTRFAYYEEGPHLGKLRVQIDPVGDRTELAYDDATGLLRQVMKVFPDLDPALEPRRVIEVEFAYYTDGVDAGKVRTETFLIDPATGKGQRRHSYSYDDAARETTIVLEDLTDPAALPRKTVYRYTDTYQVAEVQDALENTTTYVYGDSRHPTQPTEIIDPNLVSTPFEYNEQGNLVYVRDADGNETRHVYCEDLYGESRPNHRNLLYEVHRPLIQDPVTFRMKQVKPTKFGYDEKRNLETVTDAKGQVTAFTRRADGLVTEVKDRRGKITRFSYTSHDNLESITTPGTAGEAPELTTLLEYDPEQFDRLLKITDPSGASWRYEYDDIDRLVKSTDPRGHSVTFEYEKGLLQSVVAPPNHGSQNKERRTSYKYDLAAQLERILAEVTPGGSEQMRVRYEYDGLGQLRSLVRRMNGAEKKTSYQYDLLGRHTATTDPLQRTSTTEYAAYCQEKTHVSAEGRRNTLSMDQLCRLRELKNREGRTNFHYDHWSRLVRVSQPGGNATRYGTAVRGSNRYGDQAEFPPTKEFQYDDLDRLVQVMFPDRRTIRYEHDEEGNVTAVVDAAVPGRRTDYTYLDDGRLRTVSQDGKTFRYEYAADGRLLRLHYPSSISIVADFAWDVAGNLEEIHYKRGGLSLHRMKYLYDPSGNRSHFVDTPMDLTQARTWEYRYDCLNRLKTVYQDGELASFYDFDESDNRLRMDKLLDGVLYRYDYSYDAADQISGVKRDDVAIFEFRHDRDGNMTSKSDLVSARSDSYAWNDAGRLVSISVREAGQSERVTRNEYDAGNIRKRRIGSDGSKTDYYYSGLPTVTEIKSTPDVNENTSFLVGHQVLGYTRNGDSFWFITDALGSVRAVVDSDGDIVASYTYDENANIESGDREGMYVGAFGVQDDGDDLLYMRNRWFSPSVSAFLSPDPLGHSGGLNLYAYAGGNPVNYIDPDGLNPGLVAWWILIRVLAHVSVRAGAAAAANPGATVALGMFGAEALLGAPGPNGSVAAPIKGGGKVLAQEVLDLSIDPLAAAARLCPSPDGRNGGPLHRDYIKGATQMLLDARAQITGGGIDQTGIKVATEEYIRTSGGVKGSRSPDITASLGQITIRVNVGRETQLGLPVARERYALDDIVSARPGAPIIFVGYNSGDPLGSLRATLQVLSQPGDR